MYGKTAVPEAVMRNAYGGNLSQRAANATRRRQRKGGGNQAYWADTYKPHETVPSNVRLIPVECSTMRADDNGNVYEEKTAWKEFTEHYHGYYKSSGICSAGPLFFDRAKRSPCHGCDIYWEAPKKQKPISMSPKYGFAALVMEPFHQVPRVDQGTGQYIINPNTQRPYTNWERCLGHGCQHCRVSIENVQGRMQPWIMSKSHFNNLNAYSDRLGCLTCGARSTPDNRPVITTAAWQCGNPACRQLIFDMSNTTATLEQIQAVVGQPYVCPYCNTIAYPEELLYCANCTPNGQTPQRATIFDVDLQVIAPKTGDGDQTTLIVLASSDPRPINPQYAELLKYIPDLEKRFAPDSLEDQSRKWHRNAAQQQAYGQPQPFAQQPSPQGYAPQPQPAPQVYAHPYGQQPAAAPGPAPAPAQPAPQPAPQPGAYPAAYQHGQPAAPQPSVYQQPGAYPQPGAAAPPMAAYPQPTYPQPWNPNEPQGQ